MTAPSYSTAPDPGDEEIVRLVRERDGEGLHSLLQRHGSRVRGALRMTFGTTLSDSDMDDVLSTATFRAWQRIDQFDAARGSLRAWFYVVCRNVGHELLRARRRRGLELGGDSIEGAEARQPNPPSPTRFQEALQRSIAALPRLQRAIIEADLRSGDVADADELARTLNTTKNAVYVSRSNARKALKQALLAQGIHLDRDEEQQPS